MRTKLLSLIFCIISFFSQAQNDPKTKESLYAAPNGRAMPSPFPSLPFPSADWIGGPVIGASEPNATDPKLHRLKIYGWINPSGNISSSKNSNVPLSYSIVPNTVQLDQFVVRFERTLNTVQTEHFDWGFRLSNVYGIDYRYTIAKGLFSDQLLKKNNLYGYDPTEAYLLGYFPHVMEGMILKVGRYISPADIEAQLTTDNYLFTHSTMFTYDPYTFTGALAVIRANKQVQFELGTHFGNDVMPWSSSANLNGLAMVRWVSKDNNNSIYGGINALGKGKFTNGHDNLQMMVGTWGHRFNNTVHTMTELYYVWQHDAYVGGTVIDGPPKSYFTGVGIGTYIPGLSNAIGFVNYTQILLSTKSYLSIRNGLLDDPQGQRTGFATTYSDHTIGFVHHFNDFFLIRPELRYEHSYANGVTPYDNGLKKEQYTATMDLIYKFTISNEKRKR